MAAQAKEEESMKGTEAAFDGAWLRTVRKERGL
jgi:hypothetical protein